MVVGTGSDSNPAGFGQLRLDDSLLQHVPGVPHPNGSIVAAGHAGVSVCGVPLCVCAGTDVALGVSEVPDVHVPSHADASLLAITIIHLDLRGAGCYQKGITCGSGVGWVLQVWPSASQCAWAVKWGLVALAKGT